MRNIYIVTNCQSASIASCLKLMLTDFKAIPIPITEFDQKIRDMNFIHSIKPDDIWIVLKRFSEVLELTGNINKENIIIIPHIYFYGFHPDFDHITLENGDVLRAPGKCDYHSKILLSLYLRGVEKFNFKSLYSEKIFDSLNYFNIYNLESIRLVKSFNDHGFDGNLIMQNIKYEECFMHTFNHPKISLIFLMCQQIFTKITNKKISSQLLKYIIDPLHDFTILPIYPEIANYLGFEGSYFYKFGPELFINNFDNYLDFVFRGYDKLGPEVINSFNAAPQLKNMKILDSYL